MRKFVLSQIRSFCEESHGQAITEYGAILAFVSCLIGAMHAAGANNPNGGIMFWLNWIGNWKLSLMLLRLIGLSS